MIKKIIITLTILLALVFVGLRSENKKPDVPQPSGENVSGGYTLPDPCANANMDCNLGK